MDYFMPVRLYSGNNCVGEHTEELAALGERCTIVCGKHAAKLSGALDDCAKALLQGGVRTSVWDGVSENPPLADCRLAGSFAAKEEACFIVGIGGGSALDAAKAVAVFATNPDLTEDSFYSKAWKQAPLPIVLIGTTAGTGSEVTKVSVLTDSCGRKHSIHDDRLYAVISFGDSRYTQSCPQKLALAAGVDVLAHATESYFSRKADEITRAFSIRAIRRAFKPLEALAQNKSLVEKDYEELYEASILAGLAINITGTCFPHNVGYYLTETYNVAHGFASAAFLPDLLEQTEAYDVAYAQAFFSALELDKEELVSLVDACLPIFDIEMSVKEIDTALPRWENNGSVTNTRAEVDASCIKEMLEAKFINTQR